MSRFPARLLAVLAAVVAAVGPGLVGVVPSASAWADERSVASAPGIVRAVAASIRSAEGAAPSPSLSASPSPSVSTRPDVPAAPLDDPYRPQQWHLDRIGLDRDLVVPDGAGQVVAVLDSGVDLAHPDLLDVLVRDTEGRVVGRDLVDGDDVPQDAFGHGTMVAGVAAAQAGNGLGIAGVVSGGVRLLPVRVLDEEGRGTTGRVAAGLDWAVEQGATVVNLSLESAGLSALRDDATLDQALTRALDAGVAVVVAAGNGAEAVDPTSEPGLVVVGATDRDDRRAGFSDRGRTDLLMAPGVEIVSTWCRAEDLPPATACDGDTHTYGIADGTSFAAPQVSGLVAMLASAGLDPHQALDRLAATAVDLGEPGPDTATGRGRVALQPALGDWPDAPVPAAGPAIEPPPDAATDAATSEVVTPGRGAPTAVVGATPPPSRRSSVAVRVLVVTAVLAAVGIVARGLVGGRHRRHR